MIYGATFAKKKASINNVHQTNWGSKPTDIDNNPK